MSPVPRLTCRYTELKKEAPEFIDPRPPASWPHEGVISVEKLAIRYAVGPFLRWDWERTLTYSLTCRTFYMVSHFQSHRGRRLGLSARRDVERVHWHSAFSDSSRLMLEGSSLMVWVSCPVANGL
jgi:hypothetical protein